MIRHSQSYLFGAISGTAVIAAAVVFFILLVSAQALRDWPISDLSLPGSGNTSTSVSPAQSLGGGSANAAAESLNGPISVSAATVAPAAKAGGGANHHKASGGTNSAGKVSPQSQIQGSRGVQSAPVQQPSGTSPAPAPTSGSGSTPAGSGTASPAPSGGGNSGSAGQEASSPPSAGNVGTRTARAVTKTVNEISSAAPPPVPSPVTNTVTEVEERVAPTSPSSGSTSDKVKEAIAGIGN